MACVPPTALRCLSCGSLWVAMIGKDRETAMAGQGSPLQSQYAGSGQSIQCEWGSAQQMKGM
jgi:hypothetical protein